MARDIFHVPSWDDFGDWFSGARSKSAPTPRGWLLRERMTDPYTDPRLPADVAQGMRERAARMAKGALTALVCGDDVSIVTVLPPPGVVEDLPICFGLAVGRVLCVNLGAAPPLWGVCTECGASGPRWDRFQGKPCPKCGVEQRIRGVG